MCERRRDKVGNYPKLSTRVIFKHVNGQRIEMQRSKIKEVEIKIKFGTRSQREPKSKGLKKQLALPSKNTQIF